VFILGFSPLAIPARRGKVQLEQELAGFDHNKDSLITIGVFDGVHLGHKYLISQLKVLAKEQGFRTVVITFDKHPQEILTPKYHPLFLIDSHEKATLLKNEGIDSVIVLNFNKELANYSAKDFISLLILKLGMRGLVIGPDFALGRNNEGNIPTIMNLSKEMNFSLNIIPPVMINHEIVSSTSIREALAKGNMEKVQNLMSRPFSLHGKVIHGQARGSLLGYPTLNLEIATGQALPGDGVYVTQTTIKNTTNISVTNVGTNPTFENLKRTVETFLLDCQGDYYNYDIKVEFLHKIRGEIKFQSAEDLRKQISQDIEQTRTYFINKNAHK
jgi:riboflavin kinase / FMN adenylyltransferase